MQLFGTITRATEALPMTIQQRPASSTQIQPSVGLHVVRGERRNPDAARALEQALEQLDLHGTLYFGFPVAGTSGQILVDGLLTCLEYGVIAFDFAPSADSNAEDAEHRQDELYLALEAHLKRSPELVSKRQLSVDIEVVSFQPDSSHLPEHLLAATKDTLREVLEENCASLDPQRLRLVNAAVQRVLTIKPARKREGVQGSHTLGAKMLQIEKEIANLDAWQKQAAMEMPEGPQRVRGLAGSGKTIVLALKAAYLHATHPDWTIALTFWTRSLYQQFRRLVTKFYWEQAQEEPDWTKLRLLHAWGSRREPGFYSSVAVHLEAPLVDYLTAKQTFGDKRAFEGACQELVKLFAARQPAPLFDAVLIDEAQDLPAPFFELAYLSSVVPHRVVWAYDELQNLSREAMPPLEELFGRDESGNPRVTGLTCGLDEAKRDLVLPVCYRNPPWTLTMAHALGFGVYRNSLVQFFNEPSLWAAVGYTVESGRLEPGERVVLRRREDAAPEYFKRLLSPEETVQWRVFDDRQAQAAWVVEQICQNLSADELGHEDILVIFPDPITFQPEATVLIRELNRRDIPSHLVGISSSRDEFFVEGSIAISGIYRAKGNEAPMVYCLNSQHCFGGTELIRRRNMLFTAMTRSKAWLRICGWGKEMTALGQEISAVPQHDYRLEFRVPTEEELTNLRRIHRDFAPGERDRLKKTEKEASELLALLEAGDPLADNIDPKILEGLRRQLEERAR